MNASNNSSIKLIEHIGRIDKWNVIEISKSLSQSLIKQTDITLVERTQQYHPWTGSNQHL